MFSENRTRPSWYLKGGYAIALRIASARTTKDVDLSIADLRLTADALHSMVDEELSLDLADGFAFEVGTSILELDAEPAGGSRFAVSARMAGRPFVSFHLDIGVGDDLIEPTDMIEGQGWFDFAGLPRPLFRAISREQQFAEKLHAYTLLRTERENSRVKDLVDMVLLLNNGIDPQYLRESIRRTFAHRGTHLLPAELSSPPESWRIRYADLAAEFSIDPDASGAVHKIAKFLGEL
ncbi:MAG: nucleotidyl transferase AbiEii/AbiGii toxin family protein [Bryobacteraceae bacterium]|nr:nucleotidyl transferase AbiEii/AbiGii toxin family protein [Bryobacteraceae bacterium]